MRQNILKVKIVLKICPLYWVLWRCIITQLQTSFFQFKLGASQWNMLLAPNLWNLFFKSTEWTELLEIFSDFLSPIWQRNPVLKMPQMGPVWNDIFGRLWWWSQAREEGFADLLTSVSGFALLRSLECWLLIG